MCNSVLTALGQARQMAQVRELYREMQARGPAPDKVTAFAVLTALEKSGLLEEASRLRLRLGLSPMVAAASTPGSVETRKSKKVRGLESEPVTKLQWNRSVEAAGAHWGEDGDELPPGEEGDGTEAEAESSGEEPSPAQLQAILRDFSPAGTLKDKLLAQGRRRQRQQLPANDIDTDSDGDDNSGSDSDVYAAPMTMTVDVEVDAGERSGSGAGVGTGAGAVMKLLGAARRTDEVLQLLERIEEETAQESIGGGRGRNRPPTAIYNAASKHHSCIHLFMFRSFKSTDERHSMPHVIVFPLSL
jgi:pentatricopeptide repeat protein